MGARAACEQRKVPFRFTPTTRSHSASLMSAAVKGKPVGVVEGGILQQNTRFLTVYCFPNKIPRQIEVDVSNLKVAQSIHVAELKMPEGAELKFSTNFTIAVVAIPEKEEVVVAPVAVAGPRFETTTV